MSALSAGCNWNPFAGSDAPLPEAPAPSAPTEARVSDPGVLALVNGKPIALDLFKGRVEALPDDNPNGFMVSYGSSRLIQRKPKTFDERRVMLEELVKEEALVQEAMAMGLERDPEIRKRLEETRRMVLLDALTRRHTEHLTVADAEVENYYQQYQAGFKEPGRIHLRQIVTGTLEEAEAVRLQAIQGGDFAQLASTRSVGAGKEQGGDTGWFLRELDKQVLVMTGRPTDDNTLFPQLEPVAFALEIGQVSQPVKGPEGTYYVVKMEERVEEKVIPMTQVWDQIKEVVLMQKRQQALQEKIDQLWTKAKVEFNDDRLANQL